MINKIDQLGFVTQSFIIYGTFTKAINNEKPLNTFRN